VTLKKFLLIPLAVSVAIFTYYSEAVTRSLKTVINDVHLSWPLVAVLIGAIILQLAGHTVRAYKMHFLLAPVKPSTTRFQFRALSLGYLFNTILPFRLGELVRAQVVASAETLSFGFALGLVIIERAVDAIILGLLGLLAIYITGSSPRMLEHAILLLVVGIILAVTLMIVARPPLKLLQVLHRFSSLFNDNLRASLRFKIWSLMHGLQRIGGRKRVAQYLGLTITSWTLYLLSVFVLIQYFLGGLPAQQRAKLSLSPYYGVSIPAGPANLGVYSDAANNVLQGVMLSDADRTTYNLTTWALLVVPISLIGVLFLFTKTKESLWRNIPKQASREALSDKLLRAEDISQDLDAFLDNFFTGNSLSKIVHRLELRPDFRLLKYFKGGSDAVTILALQGKEVVVKKIIPLDFVDRLKAQHDWLTRHHKNRGIVRVLREQQEKTFYAIDLEYDENNEMFFDFMHRHGQEESQQIMRQVWECLHKSLYTKTVKVTDYEGLQRYIDTHIFGCMDKAAAVQSELILAAKPAKLVINGKSYHNLYQIMQKITNNRQAMRDLATYASAKEVHGDVAIDNILVSTKTGKPLLIDPAPDGNIINGPVFDFGKNMQSLYCGYEFIFRSNEAVGLGDDGKSINYGDQRSTQYTQLCEYVRQELAPHYLSPGEQKAMLFHAGALHIRRLKHQVYQNPTNVLALYAIGVKTLNDFLAQYK
jgi:uncharacterized protein (TIRG00374 family)